ncbi:DUF6264 family protein [Microbacterium sp. A82]|uniref:DUF6264 family protein n=1 Tax=Microbacterium sp. A82 TaxID=3450452 RepID=UPI003F3982BA
MIDERPQYGEYATPEEQRRLAGLPPMDAVDEVPTAESAASQETSTPAPTVTAPRRWDRILTIALVAYGLVSVIINTVAYLDLSSMMNDSMEIIGIEGDFTNFAQAKVWGTIAAFVLVVGWMLTAWLSFKRLRTGKLTWWVPLVGAAVTMIIVSLCIAVPMMGDPAFMSYVDGMAGR